MLIGASSPEGVANRHITILVSGLNMCLCRGHGHGGTLLDPGSRVSGSVNAWRDNRFSLHANVRNKHAGCCNAKQSLVPEMVAARQPFQ